MNSSTGSVTTLEVSLYRHRVLVSVPCATQLIPPATCTTMPALLFEKRNHIAYLTFNRPEVHNSFNA
jgi:hypothetical protein